MWDAQLACHRIEGKKEWKCKTGNKLCCASSEKIWYTELVITNTVFTVLENVKNVTKK